MGKTPKLKCTLNVNDYSNARCKICCRVCEKYENCKSSKKCFNEPEKCGIAITPKMQEYERKWRWKNQGTRKRGEIKC